MSTGQAERPIGIYYRRKFAMEIPKKKKILLPG
jgi:hypothetical protein